ncbi:hypothetical protein B4123_2661 [Bacillus paralicheniformis]|nr:hypothetical protein B4123_2661 [Bacillus paralicheniformis]
MGGDGMMEVNKEELYGYYCEDCEEWTFVERPEYPDEIHCAFCGIQNVAINSDDFRKLEKVTSANKEEL